MKANHRNFSSDRPPADRQLRCSRTLVAALWLLASGMTAMAQPLSEEQIGSNPHSQAASVGSRCLSGSGTQCRETQRQGGCGCILEAGSSSGAAG
jgi:hypothetical protein